MSATTALGLNLPITATFAAPLSAYYLFLQSRVVYHRLNTQTSLGDTQSTLPSHDALLASVRAQTNFAENVPLALLLAAVVEHNGGSKKALTYALGALCFFRVCHAELGIMMEKYVGKGRPLGYFGTQAVVAYLAGVAGWLTKGYWGF